MARPIKKEPDYFPLDTDLLSNRKIRQIKRKYGSDAFHYILAYKKERELAFLRKVFQQYKAGYPQERLYPAHVYQSLQERRLINAPPRGETPRHEPLRLLATTGSPAHQRDYRLTMVRQQAMAWLLRRYFDGPITEEKAKRTISFGD